MISQKQTLLRSYVALRTAKHKRQRVVKTPKVSPLSNRGVRARRVPPVRAHKHRTLEGCPSNEQQEMSGVGALFQSATTL